MAIIISDPEVSRFDRLTSRLRLSGTCSTSGATSVRVLVKGANLAILSDQTAIITSGNWLTFTTGIPVGHENTNLSITVTNNNGTPSEQTIRSFAMPLTIAQGEVAIGQNDVFLAYYTIWPFNDLAKALSWRTSIDGVTSYVLPVSPSPSLYTYGDYSTGYVNPSVVTFQSNYSPAKFPDAVDAFIFQELPYHPEPGEYLMDMTEAPNLQWEWTGDVEAVETTLNHYGTKLHRVIISGDTSFWGIKLTKDNMQVNNGIPSIPWKMKITRVGTTSEMVWSAGFLEWLAKSGIRHIRYMSSQFSNEGSQLLPFDMFTPANRLKLTDQTWVGGGTGPQVPLEAIVQLHNKVGLDIWDNISRLCDEAYVRERAAYYRDNLDPDLKIIWTRSNEHWNYNFPQYSAYATEGFSRGLGRIDAEYDDEEFVYYDYLNNPAPVWVNTNNYTTIGTQVGWNGQLYKNTVSITGSVDNLDPQTDTTRWTLYQNGALAARRCYIEDVQQLREWVLDEFAEESDRCLFVTETWHDGWSVDIDEHVTWGDNWEKMDAIASAPFFGSSIFDLSLPDTVPVSVKSTINNPGTTRINAWKQAALDEATIQANLHVANALSLTNKVIAAGGTKESVELWCYESGQHFFFNMANSVLTAAGLGTVDQELLRQDIVTFYKNHLYDVYVAYYEIIIDGCGGRISHFDSFFPSTYYWSSPKLNYAAWGVSDDAFDRAETSARYKALRDVSLTLGGGAIKVLDPQPARRRQSSIG